MTTEDLATFDDRHTMRYTRFYPHPITDVWSAVTEAEQLEVWFAPACGVAVDARLGGRCEFAFGGPNPGIDGQDPADRATWTHAGTVTEFDPPNLVHYQLAGSYMRFELTAVEGGTKLDFVHGFSPASVDEAGDDDTLPAGPGSPWRTGFVAGFHVMLDQIGALLDGTRTLADAQPYVDLVRAGRGVYELISASASPETARAEAELAARYEAHIRANCPPS